MARILAPLLLALLWLLSRLPLALLAPLGRGLGGLVWWLLPSRRAVALRNLEICLPELPEGRRCEIAREHFALIGRGALEHGLSWYASRERLMRLIHVEGDVKLAERSARPVMWLVPHFVGLDVASLAVQLFQSRPVVSVYMPASNAAFDEVILRGRLRFGNGRLFSRFESARAVMRSVREGHGFFNLPDMDFGERDAAFVPFFGVPAATLLAPSRLARALDMVVQPVVAEVLPGGRGYRVRFLEPLKDYPSDDAVADTLRMNHWIEQEVRRMPEQYLWVHKRFKTRPKGEPSLYL
ncbi:MAG TPA: lipid A biosynthesis acyltransferase [Burkholderiaceae bacterium]|nr:lipid A biosynthesis acyltransferase [Burkholderiaceae bacterium]HSB99573.1 lipid A biosynthesis acyltransferase [Burkholderiaceae bacterium]